MRRHSRIFDPLGLYDEPDRPQVTVEVYATFTEIRYVEVAPAPVVPVVSVQELAARALAELEYERRTGRPSPQLESARRLDRPLALPAAAEPDWSVTASAHSVQEPVRRPAPYRLASSVPVRKSLPGASRRAIEGGHAR